MLNVTLTVTPVVNSSLDDGHDVNVTDRITMTTLISSSSSTATPVPIIISASVNRSSTVATSTSGSTNRSVASSIQPLTTMLIQTETTAAITSRRTNSHVTRLTSSPSTGGASDQRHQHPSNVSTSPQHQQHAAASSASSPSSAPATTRTTTGSGGLPVALLWLPYAALTLFLTALLVASFVHFHCKNGHKYKRRRSPSSLTISSSTPGNGSGGHWRDHIVDHIIEQSSTIVADPATTTSYVGGVDVSDGVAVVNRTISGRAKSEETTTRFDVSCDVRSGGNKGRSNRRQSVEFVSNRNGSMVNMRGIGTSGTETGRRVTSSIADSRQGQCQHPRLEHHQNPSQDMPIDKSKQPLVAAFRQCIDSNPLNTATGSGKSTIRSMKARIAPSRGRLGTRSAITTIDEARSVTDGGVCPSSSSSLYSAVRICQMDDTADDWNRLLTSVQSRL